VAVAGSSTTVPGTWNGFIAALLGPAGAPLELGVMQAHGYDGRGADHHVVVVDDYIG
jgi:hypothetical protein